MGERWSLRLFWFRPLRVLKTPVFRSRWWCYRTSEFTQWLSKTNDTWIFKWWRWFDQQGTQKYETYKLQRTKERRIQQLSIFQCSKTNGEQTIHENEFQNSDFGEYPPPKLLQISPEQPILLSLYNSWPKRQFSVLKKILQMETNKIWLTLNLNKKS